MGSLAVANRCRVFEKWGTNRRRFRVPRILKDFADKTINKFCERLRLPLFLNSFSISVEVADSVRNYPWSGFGDASCADLVDVRATSCRAGQGRPRVCPARVFFSLWCVRGLLLVVPACPGLLPLRRAPLVAGEGRPTLWSLVLFEWSRRWNDQNSEQRKKLVERS